MKIIITGATGFVGAHMVRHFSKGGHEVIAVGRQAKPPAVILQYAAWLNLDLEDENYPILEADVIVHAAGMATDRGSYQSFYKSNVEPSLKLYKKFKGNHFIYISSSSLYPFTNKPLKEEDGVLHDGMSHYGKSKLEAENLLIKKRRPNCKLSILRPRSIYGTNDRVLLPKILKLYKRKIFLLGSMDIEVSMTHISNLILAVEAVIEKQKEALDIFNVADHQIYNLKEVITCLINKLAGRKLTSVNLPLYFISLLTKLTAALRIPFALTPQSLDYLSKSCLLDTSKIRNHFDVDFQTSFDQELESMVGWIEKVGLGKVKSGDPGLPWLAL